MAHSVEVAEAVRTLRYGALEQAQDARIRCRPTEGREEQEGGEMTDWIKLAVLATAAVCIAWTTVADCVVRLGIRHNAGVPLAVRLVDCIAMIVFCFWVGWTAIKDMAK